MATAAVLSATALLIRLPHLWTIPSPTDEVFEVLRGLDIAEGRLFPLTNVASYIGVLFNYVLAAIFILVGPSPYVARGVVAVAGALTVPTTYLLARELGARRQVAVIAAGLLATSGGHILVNSHIAWSHSLTPLVTTIGLWLLVRAIHRNDGRLLVGAGALLGLAVQTHSSALPIALAAAIYAAARCPRWLTTRWPYLAGLAFVVVNLNLIVFNAATGGESFTTASRAAAAYARTSATGVDLYLENLGSLLFTSGRLLSGAVDVRETTSAYLSDPVFWLYPALAIVGLTVIAVQRTGLPALVIALYVAIFPLVNAKWDVVPNARYLTPILPLAYTGIAVGLASALRVPIWPSRGGATGTATTGRHQLRHPLVYAVLAGTLIVWPLIPLSWRYDQLADSETTSNSLVGAIQELESRRQPGEWVALDPDLDELYTDGGGDYLGAFQFLLRMRRIPHRELEVRPKNQQGYANPCQVQPVELRWVQPERTPRAARFFPDDPRTPEDESRQPYWLLQTVQRSDAARLERSGQTDEWHMDIATYLPPVWASTRAIDRCAPNRLS